MKKTHRYIFAAVALALMVIGCLQDKGTVTGKVTDNSVAVSNADVVAVSMEAYLKLLISTSTTIDELKNAVQQSGESS